MTAGATATVTVAQVAENLVLSDSIISFVSFADTTQLTATVSDANGEVIDGATVTWATSDDAVATVSSTGLVISVANGSATITVTSGSLSATASVSVAVPFYLAANGGRSSAQLLLWAKQARWAASYTPSNRKLRSTRLLMKRITRP